MRFIRLDNKDTKFQGRVTNKFAGIRELWKRRNCQKAFFPNVNVTIDKQLFPCQSGCPFAQLIPQKPAKFGTKMDCDAEM